jgi:hypothetical protein
VSREGAGGEFMGLETRGKDIPWLNSPNNINFLLFLFKGISKNNFNAE